MRFVQFTSQLRSSIGVEIRGSGKILDLCKADKRIPTNIVDFLKQGLFSVAGIERLLGNEACLIPKDEVNLLPPVTRPDKLLCVGLNYKDHCAELGKPLPTFPAIFNKFPSTIIGTGQGVTLPENTQFLDWEVEMAVVVGKETRNVKASEAMDHVFGYTLGLDMSARDLLTAEFNSGQWLIGKSMDGFCPLGPAIVTSDEIQNPGNLDISCSVNGVLKQVGNTGQLVHDVPSLLSFLSRYFTLQPGDVILTGTPPGVGVARNPPESLKRGDSIECSLEQVGQLTVKVV